MNSPFAYHASLHPWQFFITLTYGHDGKGGRVPNAGVRKRMLFEFLRRAGLGKYTTQDGERLHRIRWRDLVWIAREEQGEKGGRHHFHILLSGLPPERHNVTEAHVLDSIWEDCGGGIADVRMYDTRLDGVDYVFKGLEQWSHEGANAYELAKFGDKQDCELIMSDSFVDAWLKAQRKWAIRAKATRASSGTGTAVITGRSLPARGNSGNRKPRTKERTEGWELPASFGYGMHPAGVSFVR